MLESNDEGDIFPKRGSRIFVKVGKQYTAEEVLKTALKKHADNQSFCSLDDYVLCYPDEKVVEFVPGTTESFTVEKYKEEFLSKPYSKMDLFLCNISVYGNCSNIKNSKSNATSNQSEKKVEYNILYIMKGIHLNLEFLIQADKCVFFSFFKKNIFFFDFVIFIIFSIKSSKFSFFFIFLKALFTKLFFQLYMSKCLILCFVVLSFLFRNLRDR